MLTPAFDLSQNDSHVIVNIKVPYAKISEADVYFEDFDFKFYCKPYFLKLRLPGQVLFSDNSDASATYNVDSGSVTVKMEKLTFGEYFEGLDLLTKLLVPKTQVKSYVPKIEVIGGSSSSPPLPEELDWTDDCLIESNDVLCLAEKCGFANMYPCTVFKLKEEVTEIFDIKEPMNKTASERSVERQNAENLKFDEEHYLADFCYDDEIRRVIKFKTDCDKFLEKKGESDSSDNQVHFSEEEKKLLRRLPNKEYLLEKSEIKMLLYGVVDMLFAYAYNVRATEGENTVESAWTINKLSATLSWLEMFPSLRDVLVSCMRRTLCYPLFRHWDLSLTVLADTVKILSLGRKYVLKCFLEIHSLFRGSDPRYILNDIYITDYCVWLQSKSCRTKDLLSLADAIKKKTVTKDDVNFDIVCLELCAKFAFKENEKEQQSHNCSNSSQTT